MWHEQGFSQAVGGPRFDPAADPGYYTDLPLFARWLAGLGFRWQLCVLADINFFGWAVTKQRDHVQKTCAALKDEPNVVIDFNEPWKNGIDPMVFQLSDFHGLLACRGAQQDAVAPWSPPLGFHTDHSPRDQEWPRKAKNILEHTRLGAGGAAPLKVPGILSEPMGIAETAVPGRRSTNERDFCDYFAVADLYAAGGNIHAEDLMRCKMPGPIQDRIARQIAAVWEHGTIPLDAASKGTYTRGPLAECGLVHTDATALRTFAMTQGKKQTCVVVRPTAAYTQKTQGGWAVVNITGPHGQIVHLERA